MLCLSLRHKDCSTNKRDLMSGEVMGGDDVVVMVGGDDGVVMVSGDGW